MSASAALEQNAAAAGTPQEPRPRQRRKLSLQQEALAREFAQYGIDPEQIGFDGDNLEPIFDFDALSILSLQLSEDITDVRVEKSEIDERLGIVTSDCTVQLRDGRSRSMYASVAVGEVLYDETVIRDVTSALHVSRARALRVGLRAVGFDPVRAHEQRKASNKELRLDIIDPRTTELSEIHVLAEQIGLIRPSPTGGMDKTNYYRLMGVHFPGISSAAEMDEPQRSKWLATLRALDSAKLRS